MNDLRFAFRQLLKNPGFTTVAVLTLALGIGANTAIFSVVNAILLRPWPYPQPDQIVRLLLLWKDGKANSSFTVPEFAFYREHNRAFQTVAGFRGSPDLSLKQGDAYEWLSALRVTDGFFSVLGMSPALGRGFLSEETRPGSPHAVVLTDRVWRNAFNADASIIGREVEMNGESYTVVGVLPRGFTFLEQPADVFTSLKLGRTLSDLGMNTEVVARLKPGVSIAQAQADLSVVFEQFRKAGPAPERQQGIKVVGYQGWSVTDFRLSLLLLFSAVGVLLLIASANVASLFLARATSRGREVSIRLALGASRGRLLRQFLTESALLAMAGGAAGALAAVWSLNGLVSSIPWHLPSTAQVRLDERVLLFTFAVAVGTSVVFGLASFWQASKTDLHASLKEGSHQGGGSARSRLRSVLVVGEVALSLMLMVGAGLLIGSLYRLRAEKLGFDPHHVVTMSTPFGRATNLTTAQVWTFEQQVLERLQALPGVESAAVVTVPPMMGQSNLPTQHEGRPDHSIGGMEYRAISPQYFTTLRIPILKGRGILHTDAASSTPVVVINETLARRWWGENSPIGDRIVVGQFEGQHFPQIEEPPREVVGVVGDVKGRALGEPTPPMLYVPAAQGIVANASTAWVIRTSSGVLLEAALRKAVTQVNPTQRVLNIRSLSDVVAGSVGRPKFEALLMGLFAALALALTSVGIYGLLNFYVTQRTRELGIRLALGAQRRDVLGLVIGQGLRLAFAGVALGLAGALALTRVLQRLLYQIKPTDPLTFTAVPLALLAVALFACWLPARRAAKIDPMEALRYE